MATIRRERNGRFSVLVICPDKKRRTIRLLTTIEANAKEAAERIQEFSSQMLEGEIPGRNAKRWLDGQPAIIRERLERAGLIEASIEKRKQIEAEKAIESQKQTPTVRDMTTHFLKGNDGSKDSTKITYRNIVRNLHDFFGETKAVRDITPQDAIEFVAWLKREGNIRDIKDADREKAGKRPKGKPMAENTVRRRTGLARQVFKAAIRKRWITENPFWNNDKNLPSAFKRNAIRDVYISPETITKFINAANNWEWRLIIALAGFAGLRGASEILTLRWDKIDFEKGAIGEMVVRSPKTEHHEGQADRVVPIFPALLPYLKEAEQMAEQIAFDEGRPVEFVIDSYRGNWEDRNLNQQAKRIIKRAGHEPIPKIFPNLRASGETELIGNHDFDINDIAAWWGHSVEVALRHYSRRREDRAKSGLLRLKASVEKARIAAHDSGTEYDRTVPHSTERGTQDIKKPSEFSDSKGFQWALRDSNPRPSRCKRDALTN
jgi:integrase